MNRLLLYAKESGFAGEVTTAIREALTASGFISSMLGEDIQTEFQDFYTGDRFIDYLTFLGCSPAIALSPEDGESFCFIRLTQPAAQDVLYYGNNTRAPHCRRCKQAKENWQEIERNKDDFCHQCGADEWHKNLVWRRTGALSRLTVEVMHIYPHEAVPSPLLLDILKQASEVEWAYAYLQKDC